MGFTAWILFIPTRHFRMKNDPSWKTQKVGDIEDIAAFLKNCISN
jgi:hypothetical protein